MKHVARIITALALVAFAAPALPCGAEKAMKTAETGTQPAGEVAKSDKVAKADKGEKSKKADKSQKANGDTAQKAAATN